MKKLFSVLLALAMLLMGSAVAETVDYTGIWYGDLFGIAATMTVNADGTYTMELMGEVDNGTWVADANGVVMDDGEIAMVYDAAAATLTADLDGMALVFGREPIATFTPAEARTDATLEEYIGYWETTMVDVFGMCLSVADAGMGMNLTVTESEIAFEMLENGVVTDNIVLPSVFADGIISASVPAQDEESIDTVFTVQLLVDGTACLQMSQDGLALLYYMQPAEAFLLEETPAVEEVPAVEEAPAA